MGYGVVLVLVYVVFDSDFLWYVGVVFIVESYGELWCVYFVVGYVQFVECFEQYFFVGVDVVIENSEVGYSCLGVG